MNSGAEAVETAHQGSAQVGLQGQARARRPGADHRRDGNFAGRTTTIVGFSSRSAVPRRLRPLRARLWRAIRRRRRARAAITPNTAAFIVEPIQGEAGIVVPPAATSQAAREICTRHNVLLICDEVQTGLGRTGRLLACDHEGIRPDGLTLGKALGGGLLPVSAFLAREDVMAHSTPGDHGSTFGGNPLAAAAGEAALRLLKKSSCRAVRTTRAQYRMAQLGRLNHPAIVDIRGKGLLIGVEIDPAFASARAVCEALMAEGILSKDTHRKHVVAPRAAPDHRSRTDRLRGGGSRAGVEGAGSAGHVQRDDRRLM